MQPAKEEPAEPEVIHKNARYVGIKDGNGNRIKQSLVWNTTQNVKAIHRQLREGAMAEEQSLVALVNECLLFIQAVAKPPKGAKKDDTTVPPGNE